MNQKVKLVLAWATKVGQTMLAHKKEILEVTGIGLGVGAIVLAVKKAPETVYALDDEAEKKGEELTVMEKSKVVVEKEAVPIILATGSICIKVAHRILLHKELKGLKKENADLLSSYLTMAGMYNATNDMLKGFKKEVKDNGGEERVRQVEQEVFDEKVKTAPVVNGADKNTLIISNADKAEKWNLKYLQTGDEKWKPGVWQDSISKQKAILCKAWVDDCAETFRAMLKDNMQNHAKWMDLVGFESGEVFEDLWYNAEKMYFDYTGYGADNGTTAFMEIVYNCNPEYVDPREARFW